MDLLRLLNSTLQRATMVTFMFVHASAIRRKDIKEENYGKCYNLCCCVWSQAVNGICQLPSPSPILDSHNFESIPPVLRGMILYCISLPSCGCSSTVTMGHRGRKKHLNDSLISDILPEGLLSRNASSW